MPAPVKDPCDRTVEVVAPADAFGRGGKVWVHCLGAWWPGRVEAASAVAALVTYRTTTHHGTAVDTVIAVRFASWTENDDVIDHPRQGSAFLPGRPRFPAQDEALGRLSSAGLAAPGLGRTSRTAS